MPVQANTEVEGRFQIEDFETKEAPMPHHLMGLSYTASGYGRKIPTTKMVKDGGRWKRIYCCVFSNAGTCYFIRNGKWVIVY